MTMTSEDQRRNKVTAKLGDDLHQFLLSYKTFDRRSLTQGEVAIAIGRLLAFKSGNQVRLTKWLTDITIAANVELQQRKST
jgi:hypothetical protein